DIGSGKTTMINHLAGFWEHNSHRFRVVKIEGFKMRDSRISSIMRELIVKINPSAQIPVQIERIYHALTDELRAFTRNRNNRVILMVDEAQDWNLQTFRDVKKIYEINGNGMEHLLSVVFFGKPHKKWNWILESEELGFRIDPIFLEKLDAEEMARLAEERFGLRFVSKRVKDRFVAAVMFRTPLGIEYFARSIKKELGLSEDQQAAVTEEIVLRVPMLSIRHRIRQAGGSMTGFAKFADTIIPHRKISIQRVSEFNNGKLDDEKLNSDLMLAGEEYIKTLETEKRRRIAGE
ncbi:MAG TPA: ATP-binding protein, partial [Spirochaetota bacterium]|nr:ATP-binding protein [Spirochaetota bacterium]